MKIRFSGRDDRYVARPDVVTRSARIGERGSHRPRAPRLARAAIAATALALTIGACGAGGHGAVKQAGGKGFDRRNFSSPTRIDNKWLPLVPGTELVYEGRSTVDGKRLPHRQVFVVSDVTKMLDGVRTLVVWDRDFDAGRLAEGELAFFAQDNRGNVWSLGEYPEIYKRGKLPTAPNTWVVPQEGARAGLHIPADPRPGTARYSQGYAPKIGWGDVAKAVELGQKTCVPVKCYDNVLVTDETNLLQPGDGHQLKYYAAGVGNIRASPGQQDSDEEALVLVKARHLNPQSLAYVRAKVLEQDKRAYVMSKDVYGRTAPAEELKS
jgi:hypothetical protein